MSDKNPEISQFSEDKNEDDLSQDLNPKEKQTKIQSLKVQLRTRTILSKILAFIIVFLSIFLIFSIVKNGHQSDFIIPSGDKPSEFDSMKNDEEKNLRKKGNNIIYKVGVYTLKSFFHPELFKEGLARELLDNLEKTNKEIKFTVVDSPEKLSNYDLALIYVLYGGSEPFFAEKVFPVFKGPYYLLTYGAVHSLPTSLEILTFIKQKNRKGEVLHGSEKSICKRINELIENSEKINPKPARLGVLGTPGEWLIGSNVDYKKAKEVFNIELIDIPKEKIFEEISKHNEKYDGSLIETDFNPSEMDKAFQIYKALEKIIEDYQLSGFTLRCIEILQLFKSSSCLALGVFNKKSIVATCEGDIPSMITAFEIFRALNLHAFQGNELLVDPSRNYVEFAHCTLPLDMAQDPTLDTYHNLQYGVTIKGNMKAGKVTVVKISPELNEFFVENGELLENTCNNDRCRTQIAVKLEGDVSYFLNSSLGNHHLITYGHHKKELKEYFESLGLRQVV